LPATGIQRGVAQIDNGGAGADRLIAVFVLAVIRLYRDGLAHFLHQQPGLCVAGATGDIDEGLEAVRAVQPDIVLLDRLFDEGVALVQRILAAGSDLRVIALAVSELESDILPYAQAGVSGYVMHDDSLEQLAQKIQAVARGEVLCSPQTSAMLLRGLNCSEGAARTALNHGLTKRELQILALLEEGLSNKQIAGRLYIELPTVKNHLHNLYEKLGVNRRNGAVAWLASERRAQTFQLPSVRRSPSTPALLR
jgi:DNA-binding NarL/FixJ family response regulator